MQYRHHLPLTHSLVLTLPTSLPLLRLRTLLPLAPSILEARLTISSPTSSASLLRLPPTQDIQYLLKRHRHRIRVHLTPLRLQQDLITPILLQQSQELKQCTTNDRFQTIFRPPTFQEPPILRFQTLKMLLLLIRAIPANGNSNTNIIITLRLLPRPTLLASRRIDTSAKCATKLFLDRLV